MPSMYEIYENHAFEYDELVKHEDVDGNIRKSLEKLIDKGSCVLELGVGTGRLTGNYIDFADRAICCDRSRHMIEKAEKNLKDYLGKIEFRIVDSRNVDIPENGFDCVIEGWAFGHSAIDEYGNIGTFTGKLVDTLKSRIKSGGKVIILETLGTNVQIPKAPVRELEVFYSLLEDKYGFEKSVIETDYCFESEEEAKRVMSFFFGDWIKEEIKGKRIKEFTGIWVYKKG